MLLRQHQQQQLPQMTSSPRWCRPCPSQRSVAQVAPVLNAPATLYQVAHTTTLVRFNSPPFATLLGAIQTSSGGLATRHIPTPRQPISIRPICSNFNIPALTERLIRLLRLQQPHQVWVALGSSSSPMPTAKRSLRQHLLLLPETRPMVACGHPMVPHRLHATLCSATQTPLPLLLWSLTAKLIPMQAHLPALRPLCSSPWFLQAAHLHHQLTKQTSSKLHLTTIRPKRLSRCSKEISVIEAAPILPLQSQPRLLARTLLGEARVAPANGEQATSSQAAKVVLSKVP